MGILGIYMTEGGPLEIGAESSEADLDRAMVLARRHVASPDRMNQNVGFQMMAAISQARQDAVELAGQRVTFKSVRAA